MAPACVLFRRSQRAEIAAIGEEVGKFVVRGASALTPGGVHTPKHRWVVCAALAWSHSLFPNPRYVDRVDQWLSACRNAA